MRTNIIISLIFFVSILTAKEFYSYSYETINLRSENFTIPKYATNKNVELQDIGIDKKNGNICFSTNSSWGDMPFKNNKINFKKGFMAPTKGFKLAAMGSSENDIAVVDMVSKVVMDGKNGKYDLPNEIKTPSGIAFHKGYIYITDNKTDKLFQLKLNQNKLEIFKSYSIITNVCGLDSDDKNLYICDNEKIYRLDSDFLIDRVFNLNKKSINGIIYVGNSEFFAVDAKKNVIYRFYK